jgi:lauroyl/myristoyl acyltransferase
MQGKQLEFALASRRFFQLASWVSRLPGAPGTVAQWLGKKASPYRMDSAEIQRAIATALALSEPQAEQATHQWLASHGIFGCEIFSYHQKNPAWAQRYVHTDNPDALAALRQTGGLVLIPHSHHHNTLGIVLGQSGIPTWGVAATEVGSPMAPYTGQYMRIINGQSEAKFAGGKYLFTDEPRAMLKGIRNALGQRHAVVTLCDNPVPPNDTPPAHFLGKTFHVGTGVISQALACNAPVTLGILYPTLTGAYHLGLQRLPDNLTAPQVIDAYFNFLAAHVAKAPWAWQGWHWYNGLADSPPSP